MGIVPKTLLRNEGQGKFDISVIDYSIYRREWL